MVVFYCISLGASKCDCLLLSITAPLFFLFPFFLRGWYMLDTDRKYIKNWRIIKIVKK